VDGTAFRRQLRSLLEEDSDRILLRIVLSSKLANPIELTGSDILSGALALANRYATAPASKVVLLLLPHSLELFLLHLGLILNDRLPAILPWPTTRIDPEKYQRNLLHQLRHLPASQIITLPLLANNLGRSLPYTATACEIEGSGEYEQGFVNGLPLELNEYSEPACSSGEVPQDALFLQFSGGTTGAQKSVVVTAPMLTNQLDQLRKNLAYSPHDSVVSWLPMYHDMGLIACLWFPLWHRTPSLHFSASDWLLKPDLLFRYLEQYGGTFCWLPNFAFSYLAGLRDRFKSSHSLGQVRAWINCSEPVRLRSLKSFADTFAEWGVSLQSLQASYAMAENVFAVTQTTLGSIPATFPRSRLRHCVAEPDPLAFDLIDDVYVSSGCPLAGMEVRIVQNGGDSCSDARPGEIQIRTESLFMGYWGNEGFVRTALSADGWYSTRDYGFMVGGELYVIGRLKDIIIVGGQNVFPEDIEAVVNSAPGVYPGRVVAFGIQDEEAGTENMVVVAEWRGFYDIKAAAALERQIHKLVMATAGIAPRYVAVVPERWIVKSTAGKISRKDTRQRFLQERLVPRTQSV
jgi:fatty-acyl-CoA synthase